METGMKNAWGKKQILLSACFPLVQGAHNRMTDLQICKAPSINFQGFSFVSRLKHTICLQF